MEVGPTTGTGSGAQVHRRLFGAQEQAAATREIREALRRGGGEQSKVLLTTVDRVTRMCRAQAGQLHLVDGEGFRSCHVSEEAPADAVRCVQVARFRDRGAP